MKVLVIEDELLVAESLMKQVKQVEPSVELIGPLPSLKSSLKWLSENPQPDLILSDINNFINNYTFLHINQTLPIRFVIKRTQFLMDNIHLSRK